LSPLFPPLVEGCPEGTGCSKSASPLTGEERGEGERALSGEKGEYIRAYRGILLCGLIKSVAFSALGLCLEVIVSLQPNRDLAIKRRRYRGNLSSKISEKTFKEEKPRMGKLSAEGIL